MRTIFSFVACLLIAVQSQAQLRVLQDGSTQMGTAIVSNLNLGGTNQNSNKSFGIFSMHFYDRQKRGQNISVFGFTYGGPSPESLEPGGEIAIGVMGEARASSKNFGLYGYLPIPENGGINYGSALYATVYPTPKSLSDSYAGYFDGRVGMSNNLDVEGNIKAAYLRASQISADRVFT